MKPNRFIANSDYLALAQTSKNSANLKFAPEPHDVVYYDPRIPDYVLFAPSRRIIKTISVPAVKGAIEEVQITYFGVTYAGNELLNQITQDSGWMLQVARVDENTVNVTFGNWTLDIERTSLNDPPMTPEIEFDVAITTFRPPNTT